MKKYILFLLPAMAILSACNDLLDKSPQDAVNSAVYFKDESQLEQYSNQFYTLFPSAASMYNEVSDHISITELADEIRGSRVIPTNNSGTNWNWTMLRHINYLIEHVNQCSDAQAALEYEALARFFRAYLYYDRIRHYGDVPWVDHTLGNSDEQLYKGRDSRKVVAANVIADLDFAIKNMTDDRTNVYRANRYTAMALKSRFCLFEGTWRKYHNLGDWEEMLRECAAASKQLIDLCDETGYYALYQSADPNMTYRELFTMGTVTGCREYLLARCYNNDLKLYHNVNSFTTSPTTGKPGFTKRFVNQYLMADGSRFTDKANYKTMGLGEEMTGRDPRMEQTILRPGYYKRIGETELVQYNAKLSATGYQLIKYVAGRKSDAYNGSDCDMPLFRLAEVYLNYAEAKAELDEFDELAERCINDLRNRVGMINGHIDVTYVKDNPCPYMKSLYPNVSPKNEGLILEVRRERNIELVQEGFHYWDLMRWKEGKSFEQPYYGIAFKGVSNGARDTKGEVDVDGDGKPDICVWTGTCPKRIGPVYLEVGRAIILSEGKEGGYILCNGSGKIDKTTLKPIDPTAGRVWTEPRDYLYPIPVEERVLTGGVISQNPGWGDGLSF